LGKGRAHCHDEQRLEVELALEQRRGHDSERHQQIGSGDDGQQRQ
jgi:hypothetical protein